MEKVIKKIKKLEEKLSELHYQLKQYKDGFFYLTELSCHGSVTFETHNNEFFVKELCEKYWSGEDGIVDVYTTNPNPSSEFYTVCGKVHVMTLEEIQNISQEDISMSEAIFEWISPEN